MLQTDLRGKQYGLVFGWAGLVKLSHMLRGDELLHVGVRPFGFHAGNALVMVAYPLLLARLVHARGVTPRFTLLVSINDWEPADVEYPLGPLFPNNMRPARTVFRLMPDPHGCCPSVCDHFEPLLREEVERLSHEFPEARVRIVRNSSLLANEEFSAVLVKTLSHPVEVGRVLTQSSGGILDETTARYVGAVCPACQGTHGNTHLHNNRILRFECTSCGRDTAAPMLAYDFWWHYAPLRVARAAALRMQIHLTGGDHWALGDIRSARSLFHLLAPQLRPPTFIVAPIVVDAHGCKMSKRNANYCSVPIEELLDVARGDRASIRVVAGRVE